MDFDECVLYRLAYGLAVWPENRESLTQPESDQS
jgi:hypothetical protein